MKSSFPLHESEPGGTPLWRVWLGSLVFLLLCVGQTQLFRIFAQSAPRSCRRGGTEVQKEIMQWTS